MTSDGPGEHDTHCEALVREGDRNAWLASLFAPADKRPALHALDAFALEVSRIRLKIREPLAGELRLQWWSDAIEGETRGDVRGHPVASALLEVIRSHGLPRGALTGFIDAKRKDLYDEPVPDVAAFDARADQTEGALLALRIHVLSGPCDRPTASAARHAGRAVAVLRSLRDLASETAPVSIPVSCLAEHGVDRDAVRARPTVPGLRPAIDALRQHADDAWKRVRTMRTDHPRASGPAFLPASLVLPILQRVKGSRYDPFANQLVLPQWRAQWLLWRAAGRRGIL